MSPMKMLLLDLYGGLRHLDSLTGETTADDILNLISPAFALESDNSRRVGMQLVRMVRQGHRKRQR